MRCVGAQSNVIGAQSIGPCVSLRLRHCLPRRANWTGQFISLARAYSKNREGTTMSVKREYQRVLQQVGSESPAPPSPMPPLAIGIVAPTGLGNSPGGGGGGGGGGGSDISASTMGLIIGLVVGGLVLVVLAVFGYMAWDYRRNQGRLRAAREAMMGMEDPEDAGPGDGKWTMVHNGLVGLELEDQGHSSDGQGSGGNNNNNNRNDHSGNVDGSAALGGQQGGAAGGDMAGGSGANTGGPGANPSARGGTSGAGSSQEISPAEDGNSNGQRQQQLLQQGFARPEGQAFGDPYVTLVLADEPGEGVEGRGAEQGARRHARWGLWQALARAVRGRGTPGGVEAKAGHPSQEHVGVSDGGAAIGSGPDLEAGPGAGPTARQAAYGAATTADSTPGQVQAPAVPAGHEVRAGAATLVEQETAVCGDAAPAGAPGVPQLPLSVPATAEAVWVPDLQVSSAALLAEVRLELAPGEAHQADSAAHQGHHNGRAMEGEGKPPHRHLETRESSASSLWRAIQLAMHGRDSRAKRHTAGSTVASTTSSTGTRTSISKDDHTTRSVVQLSDCGSMLDGYADSMCLVGTTRRLTGEGTGVSVTAGRVAARASEDSGATHGVLSGRGSWQQPALKATGATPAVTSARLAH